MDDYSTRDPDEREGHRARRGGRAARGASDARSARQGRGGRNHFSHRGPRAGDPGVRLHELLHPLRLGRAMRRRGVRQAILAVLLDEPMHGYQVIQDLEARTGGRWRPSAGSVYPTLQQLEDEGLVKSEEQDGRRVYTLTDTGRSEAEESPLRRHPWFTGEGREEAAELRRLIAQLAGAAVQVGRVGSEAAQGKARTILADARRELYRLLAEDDGEGSTEEIPEDHNGGEA